MKTIYAALAKAQGNMTKALKDSENPHFRSKYADLSSVMDACLPALNDAGIAVFQPTVSDESGSRFVRTVLAHSESDDTLECDVPLLIQKNDMQGYGSAVTYARRYGLMCMAGIAPDDDDGNAAAKAAPKAPSSAHMKRQLEQLDADLVDTNTGSALTTLWHQWSKLMNNEGWPQPEHSQDENSYRNIVRDKFKEHKTLLDSAKEPEQEPEAA